MIRADIAGRPIGWPATLADNLAGNLADNGSDDRYRTTVQPRRGPVAGGGDPVWEHAIANALVRRAGRGESGPVLRVYRPNGPVVAFSRRDRIRPGFATAVRLVRDAGFTPVLRASGGRAVAYTEQALVVDHASPDSTPPSGIEARFRSYAALWADVLRTFGIDARVGAVPGEYCPGAYSVNARGVAKLVGTAQRIVRGAWLFSAVLTYDGADVLRPVLDAIYRCLDLPFDPASVGSVRDEAPGASLDAVEHAIVAAYGHTGPASVALTPDVISVARGLLDQHRLPED
jgi:lipoate-protein ligase A